MNANTALDDNLKKSTMDNKLDSFVTSRRIGFWIMKKPYLQILLTSTVMDH